MSLSVPGAGRWAHEPQHTDELVRERTGRGWDDWRALIEAWPGHTGGHTAIAQYLAEEHGVDSWWAQSITVGFERITGRRAPGQGSDGLFEVSTSRTVAADAQALRERLLDESGRTSLLGLDSTLRSNPEAKGIRLGLDEGVLLITLAEAGAGRSKVTVTHGKLPDDQAAQRWRSHWASWLKGLAAPSE